MDPRINTAQQHGPMYSRPFVGAENPPTRADESGSRIRDGVSGAEQLLSDLQTAVDQLEQRLDTALTPTPPSQTGGPSDINKQMESHLAGRLGLLNEGLQYTVQRLHALRLRVEV